MEASNITIESPHKGLMLDCLVTRPESNDIKGIVQIVHGMAEHKERYIPFMKYLSLNGFVCIISDTRGHGKSVISPSDLGYFYGEGTEGVIGDVFAVNSHIRNTCPGVPVFLLGHSMGALISRWYLHEHPDTIDGLFVIGNPGSNPAAKAGKVLCKIISAIKGGKKVSKLIHNLTVGPFNKAFPGETENSWICSDPEVVKEYNADPLCGFPLTLDGYGCLLDFLIKDNDRKLWAFPKSDKPIMFLSGSLDPCMQGEDALRNAVNILIGGGYPNTGAEIYSDMRHEILNENGKEKVYADILGYLDKWTGKN